MKWAIAGLFALGLIAAVCAAVLVASLNGGDSPTSRRGESVESVPERTLVVASRDMPPMTVLGADSVSSRTVTADVAPMGAMSDAVQVVGKVLITPVKEGQALTAELFATEGSAIHLAAALEQGLRAVSVALSDSMGVEGLLYPGSVVDVLATVYQKKDMDGEADPVSFTLLENIRVLAVGDRTVVDPGGNQEVKKMMHRGARPMVTLLVNGKQAEMLKLAMQEGSVTLALRNPLDVNPSHTRGTDMAELSPMLGGGGPVAMSTSTYTPRNRTWETVVMRGRETEAKSFPDDGTLRAADPDEDELPENPAFEALNLLMNGRENEGESELLTLEPVVEEPTTKPESGAVEPDMNEPAATEPATPEPATTGQAPNAQPTPGPQTEQDQLWWEQPSPLESMAGGSTGADEPAAADAGAETEGDGAAPGSANEESASQDEPSGAADEGSEDEEESGAADNGSEGDDESGAADEGSEGDGEESSAGDEGSDDGEESGSDEATDDESDEESGDDDSGSEAGPQAIVGASQQHLQ